jgi:uncharacterized protein (TIGR02594 family)
MNGDPVWLARARDFVGLREIKGPQHNAEIVSWWRDSKLSGIQDDETPYCAAFVNAMLERSLITSTRKANARSYCSWGVDVNDRGHGNIPLGAIVVYARPPNPDHGHVGFAVGITREGHILTLGANQSDSVSIAPFKAARLIAARWPLEEKTERRLLRVLPFIQTGTPVSTNEA